jgi:hypothetical protein
LGIQKPGTTDSVLNKGQSYHTATEEKGTRERTQLVSVRPRDGTAQAAGIVGMCCAFLWKGGWSQKEQLDGLLKNTLT